MALRVVMMMLALAGCGVDGAPTPPQDPPASRSGAFVIGEARFGAVFRP